MKPRHGWELALSSEEAATLLAHEGYNELPSTKPKSLFTIVFEVLREPMLLLLLAASIVYFILGDVREALVLFASVFVVIGITFYQEHKSERALEALRDLSSPRALVVRDGEARRIPGREVVRGDILLVKEGDRVPADALLIHASDLSADESLLTGESMTVRKRAGSQEEVAQTPGGDDLPFIYSGTLLTQGQGTAKVIAIGQRTQIGKIGRALETLMVEPSRIQAETRRAVLFFATLGLALCVIVTLLYGITRNDWLNAILAGITLAMANLPEEFPLVLAVFLALGAWRMARHNVLTRRPAAIETLGSTTVLCVDKTGTLTQNRMTVRQLWVTEETAIVDPDKPEPLPQHFHGLLEISILASEIEPFDPMERAFLTLGRDCLADAQYRHPGWHLVHEYPFSSELPAHTHVWRASDRDTYIVATKGAPETVADLCGLKDAERTALLRQVATMAELGLRVLAVASSMLPRVQSKSESWPATQRDLGLSLVGLVGLVDPIRPTVPEAIRECYQAGIRTVMITGDFPGTAQAIARQIGLAPANHVITGAELGRLSDEELAAHIRDVNVFARVVPEQKLRLVQAFKAAGEVVAMTGDGVNDAPALKAAHIGVAMGERGTDVAREAASLVLLRDDFASLVHAVRMGRRIFDNIQKAMLYIVAVHVPIAGLALFPFLFGWPMVLFPVHVVFLEFVIDPVCSIVFEAEHAEKNTMRRPPRHNNSRLFSFRLVMVAMLQGFGSLLVAAGLYGWTLAHGADEGAARAMAFTTLVLGNIGLILSNRSYSAKLIDMLRPDNPALWWTVGAALAALSTMLLVEPAREVFRFGAVSGTQLLLCIAAAALMLLWFEGCKAWSQQQRGVA
ncbi:MAG TPA: cation-translocating P-type ATPase [Burkholderiales bacterium]|nr:cation-translocating P-type ATPase [Burkholderiales bacterium]